jgi:chlorite dismutase
MGALLEQPLVFKDCRMACDWHGAFHCIQTVRQSGLGADAELIVVTHAASEDALDACVEKLKKMDIVSKVESVIRVEGAPA